jgi:hypothetical protein
MAGGQYWISATRFHRICVAVLAVFLSGPSDAAQKTMRWENGALCEFETRFDPEKYDEKSLRNTVEVIYGDALHRSKSPIIGLDGLDGRLRSNTAEFEQQCALEMEQAANLPLIALPGIEEYRGLRLEEMEEGCRFNTIESRAASGDPAALREFAPSVAKCSPFIDALEGKTDIRAVWREAIRSQWCQTNSRPEECRANHLKAEGSPNEDDRIKSDVLTYGWGNCSVPFLKTSDVQKGESMRKALEKSFRQRFKVKAFPCAD